MTGEAGHEHPFVAPYGQVFDQLELAFGAEQKDIEREIAELEAAPPALLDPMERKIAYNAMAAKLEGRAEELDLIRKKTKDIQERFTKHEERATITIENP